MAKDKKLQFDAEEFEKVWAEFGNYCRDPLAFHKSFTNPETRPATVRSIDNLVSFVFKNAPAMLAFLDRMELEALFLDIPYHHKRSSLPVHEPSAEDMNKIIDGYLGMTLSAENVGEYDPGCKLAEKIARTVGSKTNPQDQDLYI